MRKIFNKTFNSIFSVITFIGAIVLRYIIFSLHVLKHTFTHLPNPFSKKYRKKYSFLILPILFYYTSSIFSFYISIKLCLSLQIESNTLLIVILVISSLLSSILLHTYLNNWHYLSYLDSSIVKSIITISKDLFTYITLYFTILLQITEVMFTDIIQGIRENENIFNWQMYCLSLGLTALSLQIIYFFKYQLNDLKQKNSLIP